MRFVKYFKSKKKIIDSIAFPFSRQRRGKRCIDPFAIKEGNAKFDRLKSGYRLDWTEEVFSKTGSGKETLGTSFDLKKLPKISLIFAFFLLVILTRVAWLQVIKGDYYYELAEGNRIRIERIEAKRGVIYDRNNQPLVRNAANFLLYFVPADLPPYTKVSGGKPSLTKTTGSKLSKTVKEDGNLIIERVSEILGNDITSNEIKEKLSKVEPYSLESYQPLFIADNIEHNKAMLLYLESDYMPGIVLSNRTRREYFTPRPLLSTIKGMDAGEVEVSSLSHILGYTGKISKDELTEYGSEYLLIDYIGKMGIEYFWENELKGMAGKKQVEVDVLGKEKKIINQELAQDGHNLILSIDIELQKKLEQTLNSSMEKSRLAKAAAIITDPNNGEILAMVSLPAYNNNAFARGISIQEYQELINNPDNPLFNRCISGEYPSGSIIKPVIAAAALEQGVISEHTSFNSIGGIKIGQWFFPDWRAGGHGIIDVRQAIAESVNTFFYYIGGGYQDFKGLGVDRIVKYGKLFGLNAQLGVDLAGEASGFLPAKKWKEETKGEHWYIGDTYHLSIGQGDLLVTPLQAAAYTGVFANGGTLHRPHLVKQILTGDDKVFRNIEPVVIRSHFINSYNIEIVRQGMRKTVTSGSAQSLQAIPVAVAGKTGTAQWSTKKSPHAWFTGFAPYNKPEIVITILIEQGGEGSKTAVPIAGEILKWYFNQSE